MSKQEGRVSHASCDPFHRPDDRILVAADVERWADLHAHLHAAQLADYWALDVAVDEALADGTIEGASMMTVLVLVDVRPFWLVATY
jgi:hypothetical protein